MMINLEKVVPGEGYSVAHFWVGRRRAGPLQLLQQQQQQLSMAMDRSLRHLPRIIFLIIMCHLVEKRRRRKRRRRTSQLICDNLFHLTVFCLCKLCLCVSVSVYCQLSFVNSLSLLPGLFSLPVKINLHISVFGGLGSEGKYSSELNKWHGKCAA